jgi:hypothetical protein
MKKKLLLLVTCLLLSDSLMYTHGGGGGGGGHGGGFGGGHGGGGHAAHSAHSAHAAGHGGGHGGHGGHGSHGSHGSHGGHGGGHGYNNGYHGGFHGGWGGWGWGLWGGLWFGIGFYALTLATTALILSNTNNQNYVNPVDQATADQMHQNMLDAQEAKQKREEALAQINLEIKQLELAKLKAGEPHNNVNPSSPLSDPDKIETYLEDLKEAKIRLKKANDEAERSARDNRERSEDEGGTDRESDYEEERPVTKKYNKQNNYKKYQTTSKRYRRSYDDDNNYDTASAA